MSFGLSDWIYWHLIHTARDYRQYSAIANLHTLQFAVTRALRFSVFTSRIMATVLYQSHCHFKSQMKSSFHSLTHFLPLICSYQFWRLDSIQFLCSQAHISAGWRLETRLDLTRLLFSTLCCWTLLYNHFARTTQKTESLLLRKCVDWSVS
jgi:hypothetical protein